MKRQGKKFLSLFLVLALALTLFVPTTSAFAKAKKKKLTISKATVTLNVKKTTKLKVKYGSKNVTSNKKTKWKSSNKKVATVSKGKITAKAAGTATISAKYSGKTVKCVVTVKDKTKSDPSNPSNPSNPSDPGSGGGSGGGTVTYKKPSTVSITPVFDTTLQSGQTAQLSATVYPSGARQAVTWRSSDPAVASVDSKGLVKGKKKGTAYIYAESVDDNEWGKKASASHKVVVSAAAVVEDFNFTRDCTVTKANKDVHIEFKINKQTTSEEELEALGYTVKDGVASADVTCATATYTFTNLPKTLDGIKQIPLTDYFGPIAASICALSTYNEYNWMSETEISLPGDISKYPTAIQAFEYLNGNYSSKCTISNVIRLNALTTLNNNFGYTTNTVQGGPYMYFHGANPSNKYQLQNGPYTFELYHGPYKVPEKNGEPEKQMIFVVFDNVNDDEPQRYIDTYESGGTWYSWGDQFQHLIATMKEAQ